MRELLSYSTTSSSGEDVERLALRIKADNSGDIYIPTAGYSTDGTQDCYYFWNIQVDDGEIQEYTGQGAANSKIKVAFGLIPGSTHTVIITPMQLEYGWLRAFGYKGTSIQGSLVNIIQDKSYMGYALSEIYTGNYFRYYQYESCNNLINTDPEALPDTVEIIGDYYRSYQYSFCSALVATATENMPKNVKAIGKYFRYYQYQNCLGLTRVNIRAINRASTGTHYRENQFYNCFRPEAPANIYIEGGIEEGGGSMGLADVDRGGTTVTIASRVKSINVYKDLVADYKTRFGGLLSTKVKSNPAWDKYEYEYIIYKATANSNGKIPVPVGGYSTSGTQNCAYDWIVSVNGVNEEIEGTGSATYVEVGEDLTEGEEYRVIIKPKTVAWGWGRAFGFDGTGAETSITEIIHDSYKCYASNRVETGNYYKYRTFKGCTNLINSYESLPTSVTTIGNHYMEECYSGCTSLVTAWHEVNPVSTTVGEDCRKKQYYGCSAMETHNGVAGYNYLSSITSGLREDYLTGAGNNVNLYFTRMLGRWGLNHDSHSYSTKYQTPLAGRYIVTATFSNNTSQGMTRWTLRYKNGTPSDETDSDGSKVTNNLNNYESQTISLGATIIAGGYIWYTVYASSYGYGNTTGWNIDICESLGLSEANTNNVYCFVDDLNTMQNLTGFSQSKVQAYYYGYVCYDFADIDMYNVPVATATINTSGLKNYEHDGSQAGYTPYYAMWGLAVDRNRLFSKFALNLCSHTAYDTSGSGDTPQACVGEFTLTKPGDLSTIQPINTSSFGSTRSSYSSYWTFAGNAAYGRDGSKLWNSVSGGSSTGYTYLYLKKGSTTNQVAYYESSDNITKGYPCAFSDNGQYAWGYNGKYLLAGKYTAPGSRQSSGGFGMKVVFSNDGLKMFTCTGGEVKQYNLPAPRDTAHSVDTGYTLNIGGENATFDISVDGKNLFVYENGTISQYGVGTVPQVTGLCFTAEEANSTIQLTKSGSPTAVSLQKCTNGRSWQSYTIGDTITLSNIGDKVYFRNKSTTDTGFSSSTTNNYKFVMSGKIAASGDVGYLLNKNSTTTLSRDCFIYLFYGCTALTAAPELPATTLTEYCYAYMFRDCTSLTTAPSVLPATTLANYCYDYMFKGCTSLTTAPELPATTLAPSCYFHMFEGCTSLTTAPSLPATTVASYCYASMFSNCTSLTTAPALPATSFSGANYTYQNMFYNCTSLTTPPALPATTLNEYCYQTMFQNCTSLTRMPKLRATYLPQYCYNAMFEGCTSLKISTTFGGEYVYNFRLNNASSESNARLYMFRNTGGTFTGDPSTSVFYYTTNPLVE